MPLLGARDDDENGYVNFENPVSAILQNLMTSSQWKTIHNMCNAYYREQTKALGYRIGWWKQ